MAESAVNATARTINIAEMTVKTTRITDKMEELAAQTTRMTSSVMHRRLNHFRPCVRRTRSPKCLYHVSRSLLPPHFVPSLPAAANESTHAEVVVHDRGDLLQSSDRHRSHGAHGNTDVLRYVDALVAGHQPLLEGTGAG